MKKKVQRERTSNIEHPTSNVERGAASRSYLVAGIQHRLSADLSVVALAKMEASCEGGSIGDGPRTPPGCKIAAKKRIKLSCGKWAIVDAADYEQLSEYRWCALEKGRSWYAKTLNRNGTILSMHRLILNAPKGLFVDHINHNGLDNRRENLRLCTRLQNSRNRLPSRGGTSKYKGVTRSKRRKKFMAEIRVNQKKQYLGYFDSEIEAAKAYDKKAKELFGEFAYLNFPDLATD